MIRTYPIVVMDDLRRVKVGSGEPSSVSIAAVGSPAKVIFPVDRCGEIVVVVESSWIVVFASDWRLVVLACLPSTDVELLSERDVLCRVSRSVSLTSSPSRDDIFVVLLSFVLTGGW